MAQVPPSSANPPPPATNGQPTSSSSNPQQVAPISWEGDRMFNVYIHDYFRKRGFYKAAKELVVEAEIGNDASPPINARQGFLFEWWSVFWMFFSAKTTGQGPDNVMLYFHWIQTQQAERNRQLQHENEQRRQLPLTTQPQPPRPMVRPPLNGVRPPGMVNGTVPMPPGPGQPSPAGQGIQYPMNVPHPPMPPTHQPPPPGAGPGPGPPPPQMNGIVDPSAPHGMNNPQRPPSEQQQSRQGPPPQPQQGHPPPSHPNTVPHLQQATQRQVSRGQHQFQSPTMAPAPPPQQGQLAAHMPPQPQFPQLGRGPPPQQSAQPNHVSPRNPSQTPTQPYQQLMNHGGPMGHQPGGPGSRSATPGGHQLTQQSPALAAREAPPQGQGQVVNEEMSRRFQQQAQQQAQQHPQHPQSQQQQQQHSQQHQQQRPGGQLPEHQELMSMETSMARIPPVFLAQMKMEAGVSDRDIMSLSYEEKSRLYSVFKKTMENYNGTTFPMNVGRNGRPPGPGQQPPMSGMPMYPQHAPPGARQPSGSAPAPQRGQKRGSTSPTDEPGGEPIPKDQSPPEKKRLRPSPQNAPASTPGVNENPGGIAPPMGSMTNFPPGHPGNHPGGYPGPTPPQQQNVPPMAGMRHPGGMAPGQTVPNVGGMGMNMPPGGPGAGMGHTMPPGMAQHMSLANQHIMGHPLPNSQVGRPPMPSPEISYPFQNQGQAATQQQQQMQMHYRQSMAAQHLGKIPPGMGPNAGPGNPGASPSSQETRGGTGPTGGPGGSVNRPPQQGKPGSMMPPPSPAHRGDNANNAQKGQGMMPPPAQPGNAPPGSTPAKEQTAPSPRATSGSSPSMRPASSSGAPSNNNQQGSQVTGMSQGNTGGPATPVSTGANSAANTTAPSPSAILTNRISPSAAMGSLPRPQTSGPDGNTASAVQNVSSAPSSAPPTSSGPTASSIGTNIFSDFFDPMDDQFGLDASFTESLDSTEFAQWIDMNPIS